VREVLLKDNFLQSAPDICRKLSVAEGEKSLDQLIQPAMSVHYNWDITNREKDKRHHDLIAAPTQLGPTSRVCYHCGWEGHFHRECKKVGQPGRWPHPQPGPCPLSEGNHWRSKCPLPPDGRRGATSYGLMGPGLLSMLHLLISILRSLR
jgi:hypothetical protein